MKDILKKALLQCDQAELYNMDSVITQVQFRNARLHNIESSYQSGYTLRIIKDGLLGFSYTKNLRDPDGLIDNAVGSLYGKVKAEYTFPETKEIPGLKTFDPEIHNLKTEAVVEEAARISDYFSRKTGAEITIGSSIYYDSIHIANSSGTDIKQKQSDFSIGMSLCYPGGAAGLTDNFSYLNFKPVADNKLEALAELYTISEKPVKPAGGKMQVLFMPRCLYALLWRIKSATNGENIFKKISPLTGKIGEQIFSESVSIFDNALDDTWPGARSFDDEGVKTARLNLVEKGVLKNFYYDLNYAAKLNTASTGHGYKATMWGGDTTRLKPVPDLPHLFIEPGTSSIKKMIGSIDRGIILHGVMGAHSGNIPNGDYSIGVSPALYVEKGKIVGRVKDAMVAGNIYETLKKVAAIENTLHLSWGGKFPAILCDDVSVSAK